MLAQNLDQIQRGAFPGFLYQGSMAGSIGNVITTLLPYIFAAAGIALLIYLIIGGLQMMISRGDPKAMQSAQGKVTNAIIGFVVVVIAFTVVQLFGQIFGLESNPIFKGLFGL